jgi:glycosyl transferase family 25
LQPPIYFINLDARPDRRQIMEAQLAAYGLVGTRVPGVARHEVSKEEEDLYCNPRVLGSLGVPRYALKMAHRRAWSALVQSGASWGVVFEDDAILSPTFRPFIDELCVTGLPADLVRFETSTRGHETQAWPLRCGDITVRMACGVGFRNFSSTGWGAAGYVISHAAALRLVDHPYLFASRTDVGLFDRTARPSSDFSIVQTDPALCAQMGNLRAYDAVEARANDNRMARPKPTLRRRVFNLRRALIKGYGSFLMFVSHPGHRRRHIPFAAPNPYPMTPQAHD